MEGTPADFGKKVKVYTPKRHRLTMLVERRWRIIFGAQIWFSGKFRRRTLRGPLRPGGPILYE